MPKYYVESGELQKVVDAIDGNEACRKSVQLSIEEMMKTDKFIDLGLCFIVSEKGFPSLRDPFQIDTISEQIISTDDVLDSL